jgi:hypothetical protein
MLRELKVVVPARRDVIDATECPRVAPSQPTQGEGTTANDAVIRHRVESVLGARRIELAHITVERRDGKPISLQQSNGYIAGEEPRRQ